MAHPDFPLIRHPIYADEYLSQFAQISQLYFEQSASRNGVREPVNLAENAEAEITGYLRDEPDTPEPLNFDDPWEPDQLCRNGKPIRGCTCC